MKALSKRTKITLGFLILIITFAVSYTFVDAKIMKCIPAEEAMKQLKNSLEYKEGKLSFQIPKCYTNPREWNIMVPGRIQEDNFSSSVHYFTDVNNTKSWEPGRRYIITINEEQIKNYTDLMFVAYLPNKNGKEIECTINLLDFLNKEIKNSLGLPNKPPEQSKEELYQDMFISLLMPYIQKEVDKYYSKYLEYPPTVAPYTVFVLSADRPNGYRTFVFELKLQVDSYIGPHNNVGRDNITATVDGSGNVKIEKFEHIKSYGLPPNYEDIIKKGYNNPIP